jgi:hypothetical protein
LANLCKNDVRNNTVIKKSIKSHTELPTINQCIELNQIGGTESKTKASNAKNEKRYIFGMHNLNS